MSDTMENDSCYRAAYLGALLARHYPQARPHMIGRAIYGMQKAARAAKAWEEKRCNVPLTERQEEAGNARIRKLAVALNETLADLDDRPVDQNGKATDHATVTLGGDPRGPCARLHMPGQHGDGFGEGFAIY